MSARSTEETLACLRLLRAKGLGNAAAVKLLRHFGSAAAAIAAPGSRWAAAGVPGKKPEIPEQSDPRIAADMAWLAEPQAQLLTINDAAYPASLLEAGNPPLILFLRGNAQLLAQPQLAIVGARTATPQGLENARSFAAELARRGVLITSGLALGVDGAAHQGALDGGGPTIAVCATGLDRVYPARHKALAHRIVEAGGSLVSEFAPGTEAVAAHFPRRNRIIAGLTLGTLVVEASIDSGSLITARLAADMGREVFAIPGSIHNPVARGCHKLIRDGAKLVESVDDILLELAPRLSSWLRETGTTPTAEAPAADLDDSAARLLAALGNAPLSIDSLVARTGLPAEVVNASLLTLELSGLAAAHQGGYQRLSRC